MNKVTKFIPFTRRTWVSIAVVLGVLAAINVIFFYYPPDTIVNFIGVENTYITIFLIAAIGGVNTFTSGVLYASLFAFASGGANPYLLGLACGVGIAIGDTIMFYLFRYGTKTLPEQLETKVVAWKNTIEAYPMWVQYVAIFLYLSISPFPNDILMFTLAVLRFRYQQIVLLILVGGIMFATLTALFGQWW